MRKVRLVISVIMLSALLLISSPGTYAAEYVFSGGPSGGAFQNYANAVAALAREHGINMAASPSGGSVENVRLVGTGQVPFSVAHSGNVLKGRKGQLEQDAGKYSEVLVVAHFYGARAQLVVRADSDIVRPSDLRGKRVGVGNAGSGAAASCELFYRQLGIWEDMNKSFIGYRAAAEALVNNRLDAFWVLAGFPNAAVLEAERRTDVRLPDLYGDGEAVGFFTKYPNFSKVVIPAGSYRGQNEPVTTFQDSALWIVNAEVPDEVVYKLLEIVFSPEGLRYMMDAHKSAKEMSIENGVKGVVTPLHPGAEKFWREKGVLK